MHVRISIPEGVSLPAAGEYVKHVEFCGEDESKYKFKYRKLESTLFFEYLKSLDHSFYKGLMTVSFNMPMGEREAINFCENVLRRGLFCEKNYYNFLGHCDSQLRSRTCYMMNDSDETIRKHLEKFGAILEIEHLGLRGKKIDLLFSPFHHSLELNVDHVTVNTDVKRGLIKQHTFTDGCGFMSQQFVLNMGRQLPGVKYPEPSAVLVRFQGFEGMLVLKEEQERTGNALLREEFPDNHILTDEHPNSDHQVQFTESMEKLTISNPEIRQVLSVICIVDYSRPHENVYLDSKMILLLDAREVSVKHLENLQRYYYGLLEKMCQDPSSADYFLRLKGQMGDGNRRNKARLTALRQAEITEMIDHVYDPGHQPPRRPVGRIRILLPKARLVFGVCDPYNKLKYGECYFQPTLLHDDKEDFAAENKVFVARSPCYHPGDIRVLNLTHDKPGYEHLKDCLVLPVRGPRSHAFECAGGDLSGKKFIVCWDAELIPKYLDPCSYSPSVSERCSNAVANFRSKFKKHHRKSTKDIKDEMINYFASFRDDLPNQIDKTYMKLATEGSGLSSKQCEQLSKLFYQATNSTVDRDVLSKRFEEFQQNSTPSSEHSFTEETEKSDLLGEMEGEGPNVESRRIHRARFSQLFACISSPPFQVNAEVLKEFEERATTFVCHAQENDWCD